MLCLKIIDSNLNMMFFALQSNELSVFNILNYDYHETRFLNEIINARFRLITCILLHHFNVATLFFYQQHNINVIRNVLIISER